MSYNILLFTVRFYVFCCRVATTERNIGFKILCKIHGTIFLPFTVELYIYFTHIYT